MGNFLISLISASLIISGLAAAVWLLEEKQFLKKFASGTKAFIWFLLILGLLIPMKPSVFEPLVKIPVSGYELSAENEGESISGAVPGSYVSGTNIEDIITQPPGLKGEITAVTVKDSQSAAKNGTGGEAGLFGSGFPAQIAGHFVFMIGEFFQRLAGYMKGQVILFVLFGIWAAGFLFFAARMAYREYCFARAFKRWAEPAEDPEVLCALDEVCAAAGYRGKVQVYLCPFLTSPVLKGLLRPSILIPSDYKEYSDIRLILAHELTHACRQDLWMKAAAAFAALIHWFNPAVKLISREMSLWCELACDEAVLKGTDEGTRIRYGMVLLNAAKRANGTGQKGYDTVFSTPLFESARQIKKRVYACADGARKKRGFALIALSAVFILASGSIFRLEVGKAETVSNKYAYPYATVATEEMVYAVNDKGVETAYQGTKSVWTEAPDGYREISTERNQEALTYRDVEELYRKAEADKRTDKLAVRFSDGGLLLIDPEELVPISPTVGGSAPWLIKAYIRLGDIWELNPEEITTSQIYDITGDVLMGLVDQSWRDAGEFKSAAAAGLAAEFGISEKLIVLDVNEASVTAAAVEEN